MSTDSQLFNQSVPNVTCMEKGHFHHYLFIFILKSFLHSMYNQQALEKKRIIRILILSGLNDSFLNYVICLIVKEI